MVTINITYKGYKVFHHVGDIPQLQLQFDLKVLIDNDVRIYIPTLKWDVSLTSTDSPQSDSMSSIGDWGKFESVGTEKLLKNNSLDDVFCLIPMNSLKIKQLLDVRSRNKMPRLLITVDGHYLYYVKYESGYLLESISPFRCDVNRYFQGSQIRHVTFNSDDLINILEQLKQYNFFRIEIPIKKEGTPVNKRLADVVKILDTAKKDLLDGNYDGVLKGTRHAIEKIIKKDENDPNKQNWLFYEDIVNCYNHNVPITAQEEYKISLNQIKSQFRSQLRIINNVYMHKDKKKVYPRPEDAEQIFLGTALLIRYLSQSCLND